VAALERQLAKGDKALVSNTGFSALSEDDQQPALRDRLPTRSTSQQR
jgi:hypothetical protein